MSQTDIRAKIQTSNAVKEPPLFKVVYLNDNATTVEFVMQSLIEYFDYTQDTAKQITIDIHDSGSACVAVLPFEIAEQKGIEVTMEARANNYPLQIKLEPENLD